MDNTQPPESSHAGEALPLAVYQTLKAIARERMAGEREGHTLQTTALVHEAYLRLQKQGRLDLSDRGRFFYIASEVMRQILVDHARGRGRQKRGGNAKHIPIDLLDIAANPDSDGFLALNEAIERLKQQFADAGTVVELRFYAGLTVEETAEAMNVSTRTVNRLWQFARAWLWRELDADA